MRPRILLLVAGWLAGAAAAATGVTLALSVLGSGLFGTAGHPLSMAQVQQQLAQAGPEPSAAAAGSPQAVDQGGTPGARNTSGGSVVVRCTSQGAVLTATPALGYRADDLQQGPAPTVWVSFRNNSAEVHVAASCATGQPRFTVSSEPRGGNGGGSPSPGAPTSQSTVPANGGGDDHGGGNGGGGDDHGGGGSGGSGAPGRQRRHQRGQRQAEAATAAGATASYARQTATARLAVWPSRPAATARLGAGPSLRCAGGRRGRPRSGWPPG